MSHRSRQGQSAVEFALMLPLIFAVLFVVIEYSYYFGAIHYMNYATFTAARAVQGNDAAGLEDIKGELLTGNVTSPDGGDIGGDITVDDSSATGELNWVPQMPGFQWVMGDNPMDVDMKVTLGSPDCQYENQIANPAYVDNNLGC